ncbi:transmembrane protein 56 [Stylonychia lemnae]|uniref:Transmembrane protein 56 n=1 Tax=Stylonychia lemnae TaxID=5949 RepID=A0A078AVK0_STYLE|nr:transmembrane protein 56 [Stylonychia lemnae]|eukprot:CDW86390.1 transmembrane protein 56 [Stylonychia lemnae]
MGLLIWGFMFFVGCYHHPIPTYYAKRMSQKDKLIWRFRVINAYHGGLAFIGGVIWYITQLDTSCTRKNNTYELMMLANTSSYLVMDGIFMWTEGFLDGGNLMHHVFGIMGYYAIAYFQHDYTHMALHMVPAEFSNVPMHMREILKRMGMRYTWSYYINDFAYYLTYFMCRGFWIPSVYYFIFTCKSSNPVTLVIYPLHVIMSWYFCSFIPAMAQQRIDEINKINQAQIEIPWIEPANSKKLESIGVTPFEIYYT